MLILVNWRFCGNLYRNMNNLNFFKILILGLFFFSNASLAQVNETLRNGNVKTQVIWVTEKGNIKELKYKLQELRFNKNGLCIEEIRYNRKGKIILHKSYNYEKGLLVREIEFDRKGFIIRRTDYKFVNKIPVEKTVYNGKGEVIRNEQMIYEYQD